MLNSTITVSELFSNQASMGTAFIVTIGIISSLLILGYVIYYLFGMKFDFDMMKSDIEELKSHQPLYFRRRK